MLRQFSGVNNRPRCLRPKDALHISLILAVTTWILYHLTYTYENNSIINSYRQIKVHQEYKIEQKSSLDGTATTDGRNVVQFQKEEREIVDAKHQNKEAVANENEVEKRIKEHEAREKSFRDDDASSAVVHDNQMQQIKEQIASEIISNSMNQNMAIDVSKTDFILGNGTINGTDLQKNTSYLRNKPDEKEYAEKSHNVLLVNLNETYTVHGLVQDADEENRESN